MGIEAKEKTIDGDKITVVTFGGRRGLQYKLRLIKAIGPIVPGLLSGSETKTIAGLMKTDLDFAVLGKAIEAFLLTIDDSTTFQLIIDLLSMVRVNGQDISTVTVFDDVFAANYQLLYKVLFFVLEVNYGRLFGKGGIGNLINERKQNQSISPENTKA